MSVQKINNVRISGIAAAVPKNIVENRTCGLFENDEDYRNFVANVGVERRRVAPSNRDYHPQVSAFVVRISAKLLRRG